LLEECRQGALDREEPWGVWGGAIFDAGRIIAVKRGRGRPRKNPQQAPDQNPQEKPADAA
ncbi:WhiB family transcriptional regulator, partial [Brachybacterium alimentarium]